jgi:hypothetical protein
MRCPILQFAGACIGCAHSIDCQERKQDSGAKAESRLKAFECDHCSVAMFAVGCNAGCTPIAVCATHCFAWYISLPMGPLRCCGCNAARMTCNEKRKVASPGVTLLLRTAGALNLLFSHQHATRWQFNYYCSWSRCVHASLCWCNRAAYRITYGH